MKRFFYPLFLLILLNYSGVFAQGEMPDHIKEKITYPVFDFHPWVGVGLYLMIRRLIIRLP